MLVGSQQNDEEAYDKISHLIPAQKRGARPALDIWGDGSQVPPRSRGNNARSALIYFLVIDAFFGAF